MIKFFANADDHVIMFLVIFLITRLGMSYLQVDDEKVISGSYDTTLKIWDLKTGHCRRTLRYCFGYGY